MPPQQQVAWTYVLDVTIAQGTYQLLPFAPELPTDAASDSLTDAFLFSG